MTPEEEARVRKNHKQLAEIEDLTLEDALAALKGEAVLTDTARGQLLKFLMANGFNADLTSIPKVVKIHTDLTAEDLAETEDEW
jgi:hypothetical protein